MNLAGDAKTRKDLAVFEPVNSADSSETGTIDPSEAETVAPEGQMETETNEEVDATCSEVDATCSEVEMEPTVPSAMEEPCVNETSEVMIQPDETEPVAELGKGFAMSAQTTDKKTDEVIIEENGTPEVITIESDCEENKDKKTDDVMSQKSEPSKGKAELKSPRNNTRNRKGTSVYLHPVLLADIDHHALEPILQASVFHQATFVKLGHRKIGILEIRFLNTDVLDTYMGKLTDFTTRVLGRGEKLTISKWPFGERRTKTIEAFSGFDTKYVARDGARTGEIRVEGLPSTITEGVLKVLFPKAIDIRIPTDTSGQSLCHASVMYPTVRLANTACRYLTYYNPSIDGQKLIIKFIKPERKPRSDKTTDSAVKEVKVNANPLKTKKPKTKKTAVRGNVSSSPDVITISPDGKKTSPAKSPQQPAKPITAAPATPTKSVAQSPAKGNTTQASPNTKTSKSTTAGKDTSQSSMTGKDTSPSTKAGKDSADSSKTLNNSQRKRIRKRNRRAKHPVLNTAMKVLPQSTTKKPKSLLQMNAPPVSQMVSNHLFKKPVGRGSILQYLPKNRSAKSVRPGQSRGRGSILNSVGGLSFPGGRFSSLGQLSGGIQQRGTGFGMTNSGFGKSRGGQGLGNLGFGIMQMNQGTVTGQGGFGANSFGFGMSGTASGLSQTGLSLNQTSFGQGQAGLGGKQGGFGQTAAELRQNQSQFGQNQTKIGQNPSAFRQNEADFRLSQHGFGQNEPRSGLNQQYMKGSQATVDNVGYRKNQGGYDVKSRRVTKTKRFGQNQDRGRAGYSRSGNGIGRSQTGFSQAHLSPSSVSAASSLQGAQRQNFADYNQPGSSSFSGQTVGVRQLLESQQTGSLLNLAGYSSSGNDNRDSSGHYSSTENVSSSSGMRASSSYQPYVTQRERRNSAGSSGGRRRKRSKHPSVKPMHGDGPTRQGSVRSSEIRDLKGQLLKQLDLLEHGDSPDTALLSQLADKLKTVQQKSASTASGLRHQPTMPQSQTTLYGYGGTQQSNTERSPISSNYRRDDGLQQSMASYEPNTASQMTTGYQTTDYGASQSYGQYSQSDAQTASNYQTTGYDQSYSQSYPQSYAQSYDQSYGQYGTTQDLTGSSTNNPEARYEDWYQGQSGSSNTTGYYQATSEASWQTQPSGQTYVQPQSHAYGGMGTGTDQTWKDDKVYKSLRFSNLPYNTSQHTFKNFLNNLMYVKSLSNDQRSVTSVRVVDGAAFVDFRTPDLATRGLGLDGCLYESVRMLVDRAAR